MNTQTVSMQWQGILRLPEVMRLTGLSRSSIYRLEALGKFPARLKLSESCSGWKAEQVQAWIDSRPLASQQKVAA